MLHADDCFLENIWDETYIPLEEHECWMYSPKMEKNIPWCMVMDYQYVFAKKEELLGDEPVYLAQLLYIQSWDARMTIIEKWNPEYLDDYVYAAATVNDRVDIFEWAHDNDVFFDEDVMKFVSYYESEDILHYIKSCHPDDSDAICHCGYAPRSLKLI